MNELDVLYSPSQWSKRVSASEIIQQHISFVTEASKRAKVNIPCELDIKYGSGENAKLDIFGVDLPADSPIFIYIHGGFWQQLSREVSSYIVEPLYKNKYKVIIVGYDLCPAVSLFDIVEEINEAVKFCIEYAKKNKSRSIQIGGHSAGAHLASSLFTNIKNSLDKNDQKLLKAIYLIAGVFDLMPLVNTYVNKPLHLDRDTARTLSPQHIQFECANEDIKFYVVVGEFDSPAFRTQSELFYKKLKQFNLKSELIVISGKDHFDLVECLNDENYELIKLIIN